MGETPQRHHRDKRGGDIQYIARYLVLISQVGLMPICGMVVGGLIGMGLGKLWPSARTPLIVVMAFVGAAAGFREAYRMLMARLD